MLSSIFQSRSSLQSIPHTKPKVRKPFRSNEMRQKCFYVVLIAICLVQVLLIVSTVLDVVHAGKAYHKKDSLFKAIEYRRLAGNLMNCLQSEREETALFLLSTSYPDQRRTNHLLEVRKRTDGAILRPQDWTYCNSNDASEMYDPQSFRSYLNKFRGHVDDNLKADSVNLRLIMEEYSNWIELLFSCLTGYSAMQRNTIHKDVFDSHLMVLRSANELGQLVSFGAMFFAQGAFRMNGSKEYNEKSLLSQRYLKVAFSLSLKVKDIYISELTRPENHRLLANFEEKCGIVRSNALDHVGSFQESRAWFDVSAKYKYLIENLQKQALTLIQDEIKKESSSLCSTIIYRSLLCFFSFLITGLVFLFIHVHLKLNSYTCSLYRDWELEKGRTDFILEINSVHVKNMATRWKKRCSLKVSPEVKLPSSNESS